MSAQNKCSICDEPALKGAEDVLGHVHWACKKHIKYLSGWLQDVASEQASECAAASRYEREYE